jgi:FtsP/CotA-like multicopper oxidase with cupredoxin domain
MVSDQPNLFERNAREKEFDMHKVFLARKFFWPAIAAALLLLLLFVAAYRARPAAAQMASSDGMVCTTGASPNPTFVLTTRTGYIGTPDGNVVFMWGLSEGGNPFQHPSPVLCVNEGDTVTIILHNTLSQDISLIFPGQENVLADGQPVQPQFDAGGLLTSLAPVAAANGGSVTYSFVASHPGTFLYESGTNPGIQVRMGLFGALVVRPVIASDPNGGRYFAYNDAGAAVTSEFNHSPSGEVLILQSEVDPYLSQAIERGQGFNLNNYHPRYWLVNGRGFPDTIAPNYASWLPSQPYGALAHVQPVDSSNPLWYMERFINVSSQPLPFHPHGKNAVVIGRDGQPVRGDAGEDLSFERFALVAAPGQTYDSLFHWHNREGYDSATNPVPVVDPGWANLQYGMYYSGSPYLGMTGPFPPGMSTMSECGEYYIIAHNHALFQLTSWGVPMTGPGTFMRVDPPGGCSPMP